MNPLLPAVLKSSWRVWLLILLVVVVAGTIAGLTIRLAHVEADNRVLVSDNQLQGQVIATQSFNLMTRIHGVAARAG